jgi:TRAP-type C4-dicarboxylate transport system permease small subunit
LPRVETLQRVRSNPKLAVAIAGGVILLLAWIGWAIHVASDDGGRAALGVLISWPLLLLAAGLVVFAVYGLYLLIRRLLPEEESAAGNPSAEDEAAEEDGAGEEGGTDDEDGSAEEGRDTESEASTTG